MAPISKAPTGKFALQLWRKRKALDITQTEMADHLYGMPLRTYQDLERGTRTCSPWTQRALLARMKEPLGKRK